jgi:type I protein arginine methyltransferase
MTPEHFFIFQLGGNEKKANYNYFAIFSGLDFLDTIKLVNYIRSEVKRGNTKFDISSKSIFDDEKFLKPVLEDDALLYSLDDLNEGSTQPQSADTVKNTSESKHIRELQEALDRLQSQFTAYRLAVQDSLDEQLQKEDKLVGVSENNSCQKSNGATGRIEAADSDYFTSYSYNSG